MDLFFTKPSWIEHFFDILWWFHYRLYSRSTKDRRLQWKDGWTNRSSLVVKKHELWINFNDQLNCDCTDYSLEGLVPQGSALQQNIHNSLDDWTSRCVPSGSPRLVLGVDLENLLLFPWCFPGVSPYIWSSRFPTLRSAQQRRGTGWCYPSRTTCRSDPQPRILEDETHHRRKRKVIIWRYWTRFLSSDFL